MDTGTFPLYLVSGSKGGVGKSLVTLALIDYLQRHNQTPMLVETNTSNPDVMKAIQPEIGCMAFDLDHADGWISLVNLCDEQQDKPVVVNTAARSNHGVARYGSTLGNTLEELKRKLVVFWVINRQRDCLELLREFTTQLPQAIVHVVRNTYFGEANQFSLYRESNLRKIIEAKGQSLDFPDLADRVSDDLRSQRLSVQKAAASMPVGHRAELLRWRNGYDAMFDRVVSHEFLSHGQ
ncbi:protein mobD [Caballeronia mineralivorans PML1(12)]|uniref:Protein mobD n=1 Tax=Caballeronia mineralivorans PML1(12) TaxID=908627 RepID=A0A0J1CWZ8_9BURK|nr:protein mobD [Caballeronia mineralivorans]KLU25095.1 protein mobD [Caballeronia mineralivorans PML1(12)]